MMSIRPCHCDRYVPERAYRPSRDCNKCWLYAHDPALRRAWGGDPAACVPLRTAGPDTPAAELADFLAQGPADGLPDGWKLWPAAREAHRLLTAQFLAAMPAYPAGRFRGRGAVICGGGAYEACAYVCCRMLRHVGWGHPIQVWHRGAEEPVSARVRGLPGVEVIDIEAHPARAGRRLMGGWESKSFAVLNAPFEEVLFLDADCYPVFNPDECFEPANNPHGIVTWPDVSSGDGAVHWDTYGVAPDGEPGLNGGHYVFTKRRAWPVLQLAAHYDNHSDFYYWRSWLGVEVGAFGDQEQIRVALRQLGTPSHRYAARPLKCDDGAYLQPGPHGRPLFVHRFANKFAEPGKFAQNPHWHPGRFPMEATAWQYFLDWMAAPVYDAAFPDDVPGLFTAAECAMWLETCAGRDVLELGRFSGRSTVVSAQSGRRVVSLDLRSDADADFWLQRYGLRHKVWLRVGYFADLIPTSGGPFSACLIDGGHDFQPVATDIAGVVPHLAPGAVIGFHDYEDSNFPGVKAAVDAAAESRGWTLANRADHLAVFLTPSAKVKR